MTLSLMQWNVGNFNVRLRPLGNGPQGMHYTHADASRDKDLGNMAVLIRAEKPDIVTLQEIVVRKNHHFRLAELSGYRVVCAGTPKERHTQVILVRPGIDFSPGPAPEGFHGVSARLKIPGGAELIVVSTHSWAGKFTTERVRQHRALAAWAKRVSKKSPLVVGGDFNFDDAPGRFHEWIHGWCRLLPFLPPLATSDWDEDCEGLEALRKVLLDLGADAGPTAGAPRFWAKICVPWALPAIPLAWAVGIAWRRSRLDCIWASLSIKALGARVIRLTGPGAPKHPAFSRRPFPWMDHDPVMADFSAGKNPRG